MRANKRDHVIDEPRKRKENSSLSQEVVNMYSKGAFRRKQGFEPLEVAKARKESKKQKGRYWI
jgi:hypothetical protein